jgi:hypothetical protein
MVHDASLMHTTRADKGHPQRPSELNKRNDAVRSSPHPAWAIHHNIPG